MIAAAIIDVGNPTGQSGGGSGQGAPTANFSWTPKLVYKGAQVTFHNTSTGSTPMSWSWSVNGSQVAVSQDFTYYPSANFLCELTATNSQGSNSDYQYITVNTNQ